MRFRRRSAPRRRRRLGKGRKKRASGMRRRMRVRRGHRKFKSTRRFGKRVMKALRTTGSYNFIESYDNQDLAPLIGYRGDIGAGYGGGWWNASGNVGGCPAVDITQLIPYSSNPTLSTRDNTRSSTRVRILSVEIFGAAKPNTTFENESGNRFWIDLEPMCWISTGDVPNQAATQSNVTPARFYADRYNFSAAASMSGFAPESFYLIPPTLQHGKHLYRKRKSKQGIQRINDQAQATTSAWSVPANSGTTAYNVTTAGTGIANVGGDDRTYVHWTIPINEIVEYPRIGAQNDMQYDASAMHPIFLDWHGRMCGELLRRRTAGTPATYTMADWAHFHIFIKYEDLFAENY